MRNSHDNGTKGSLNRRSFLGVTGAAAVATIAHMIQNIGATSVAFTQDELKELNASVSSIQTQGKRLPDGVLALSGVEAPPKA